ncbi:NADH-quinone oxidoreductase subunit M [soil metagenome]
MLTAAIIIPLLAAASLLALTRAGEPTTRAVAIGAAAASLGLLVISAFRFDTGSGEMFQLVEETDWIPSIGVGWRLGVDGISLALAVMSALIVVVAIAYPFETLGRHAQYRAWMLFLQAVSLGVFLTLDLLVFYVFFDLSLVGMYFLIGRWGHGDAQVAALKFFLYTLAGSLVMLLGFLALYLNTDPLTFDMRTLIAEQPLAGHGLTAGLTLIALLVGLAVKTPLVPVHTWLPPAHVNAPGPASAILAGVLLKMGTFGMIRIPLSMMRDTFRQGAPVLAVVAVVSIVYGALVALGQTDVKRRIAYTSVNHMGYTVLGIAVAGALVTGSPSARSLALTGATVEMVAHGLITGSLFLIAGSLWTRTETYDFDAYGGLAAEAPRLMGVTTLASFASLGLPGLVGFVAEVQIFIGTFSVYPLAAGIALIGVLITAALFLQLVQRVFFGETPSRLAGFRDLDRREFIPLGILLTLVVVLGVWPTPLLDLIGSTSDRIVAAFERLA